MRDMIMWAKARKRISGIKRDQPERIIQCLSLHITYSFFNIWSKVKLNILWNKMTLQCYIVIVIALTCLMCLYSCKSQTVFAPSCFPGKHLLSYYHNGANFADVWGGIYMTIYCHSWKAVRLCSTQCPHGILVPSPKCFNYTTSLAIQHPEQSSSDFIYIIF